MNKEIRCIAITKEKWRRINGTVTPPPHLETVKAVTLALLSIQ